MPQGTKEFHYLVSFQPINVRPKTSKLASTLSTIDDHLYLVPSPMHVPHKTSIEADHILTNLRQEEESGNSPQILRPTTAFRTSTKRKRSIGILDQLRESQSTLNSSKSF